jgi:hypothetical protein
MRTTLLVAAVAAGLLYGCASHVAKPPPIERERPADFPEQEYTQAVGQGRSVYRVDPSSSILTVEVRRGGSLARLGHDHVVASDDLQGYVLPDAGRADLYVVLDRLVVDEPRLRTEAGFDTQPPADAVAGTRRNMLEKTLEASRYPFAMIGVRRGDADGPLNVSITLHGVTRTMQVPVQLDAGDDAIDVTGRLTLAQSDFAIVPLSILGGAIQVQDRVDLRFHVVARRMGSMRRKAAGSMDRARYPFTADSATPRTR